MIFQTIISGSIALLLTMFNVYASNVISGYNKLDHTFDYCSTFAPVDPNVPDSKGIAVADTKNAECLVKKSYNQKIENHKYLYLLVFGILCIIVAVAIKNPTIKLAIILAGILTLLVAVTGNWSNYGDISKMVITGSGVALIIGLVVYYGDIFTKIKIE